MRGRMLILLVVSALLLPLVPTLPASAQAPPDSNLDRAARGLVSFSETALSRLGDNAVLDSPLPLTARSIRELLALDTVFANTLGADLDALTTAGGSGIADASALAAAIEAADETVNGVAVTYNSVAVGNAAADGSFTVAFDVAATTTQTLPLAYQKIRHVETGPDEPGEDDLILSLVGDEDDGGVPATVAMASQRLTFTYDPGLHVVGMAGSGLSLQVPGAPFTFTAAGTRSPVAFEAIYGFADIAVGGSAGFSLKVESTIRDGDGLGGVTFDEWTTMLPADLFNIARVNVPSVTDVDIALTFDSTLISGTPDGTLVWNLADASTASSTSEPTLTAGAELENFARVSPDDVLAGLGQYATVLTGAEADSSHELPFLNAGLADVYSPAGRLVQFIKRQSDAAVICGKADTQPPSGLGLPGTAWYCQAYTPVEPVASSISWDISNGDEVSTSTTGTAGVAPTANYAFTVDDGELRPDVSVTFQDPPTPTADETSTTPGAEHTVVPRFASVADLTEQLDAFLDASGATSTVTPDYDETDDALTFALDLGINPTAITANLTFGDSLRNESRIAGLEPATTDDGEVTLNASGFAIDSTFGVDLSSDLQSIKPDLPTDEVLESQGDRFFTVAEDGPEFEVGDLSVDTETDAYDLTGAVGYVSVEATGVDTDDDPSFDLDKIASSDKLLTVDVTGATGVTNGTGVDNSILLNQILTGIANHVSSDFNLQAEAHLEAEPSGNLASLVPDTADTQIDVSWPDVATQAQPTVTLGDDFEDLVYPLDVVPQLTGISLASSASAHPTTAVIDTNRNFLTELGTDLDVNDELPVTLYNTTTGASCFGIKVTSATSVQCVDVKTNTTPHLSGLAGGVDRDGTEVNGQLPIDNDWHQGNGYLIEGDADALGPIVLQGLFDVASRFENYTGQGYDTKIPVLGVTPKDLTPQFAEVGREVKEILDTYEEAAEGVATGTNAGDINGGPPASLQELVTDLRSGLGVTDSKLALSLPALARGSLSGDRRHLAVRLGTLDETSTSLPSPTPSVTPTPQLIIEPSPSTDTAFGNDADSNPDVSLSWTSKVQLDVAFPLDLDVIPTDLLVLSGTGIDDLDVTVDGTAMDFSGNFGSLPLTFGTQATKTGTHEAITGTNTLDPIATGDASETKVTGDITGIGSAGSTFFPRDTTKNFVTLGLEPGFVLTNTTDNATCTISGINSSFPTDLICAAALSGGHSFNDGDDYTYTWESATVLTDTTADFEDEGVEVGMALENLTEGNAICRITAVAETKLTCSAGLSASKKWSAGDDYRVTSTQEMTTTASLAGVATGAIITNTTEDATCTISAISSGTVTCAAPLVATGGGIPKWDDGDAWSIGSSTTTLNAPGAKFDELGIKTGTDVVKNTTAGNISECVITAVTADQLVCSGGLKKTGDVATSWAEDDTYEIGGIGKTLFDLSYSLEGSANKPLDTSTAGNDYMSSMVGAFTGTSNTCDNAHSAHLCVRLSTETTGNAPEYLGTIEFRSNADGTGRTSVIPTALSTAATAAGTPMDFDLLGEPLRYLPNMVRDGLNGNFSDEFPNVPFIGTDLSAGADVVDTLEDVALPTGAVDWETIGNAARNAANAEAARLAVKTEVDKVLADVFGTGAPTSTVTATCGNGNSACSTTDVLGRITDLKVSVTLKENLASGESDPAKGCLTKCGTTTTNIPFDLGLPGVGLKALNGAQAEAKVGWSMDLEFGLDKNEGPYLVTSGTDELQIGAGVQFRDGDTSCDTDRPKPTAADNLFPAGSQDAQEAGARVGVTDFSSRCIDANIGLFEGTLWDGATTGTAESAWESNYKSRSRLNLLTKFNLAANSGNRLSLVELVTEDHASGVDLDAAANIDALFRTKRGSSDDPDLPVMFGTLHVSYDTSRSGDPLVDPEYRNLVIDKLSFLEQFIGPWLGQFAKSMSPVLPFFSAVTTPVPVVSDVSTATGNPPFTILDLLEAYAAHKTKPTKDAKETKWKYLVKVLQVVKLGAAVSGMAAGWGTGTTGIGGLNGGVPGTGGFKVDKDIAKGTTCGSNGLPATGKTCTRKYSRDTSILKLTATVTERVKVLGDCPKAGCTGKELTRRISTSPHMGALAGAGVTFPWMNDASLLQGMLAGEDATLVRFDTGMFYAGVGVSVSFGPFMAGPIPVEIYLGITITAGFRAAFGIDTSGIRAQRDGDSGADMMDGFYFDDYDDAGNEVPEVQLIFTVTLGASVSVRIFKVGIEGEVTITFGLDLRDPNGDGKIFAAEFRSLGSDPICMWDAVGFLDFVLRVFVEVDLVLWSKRWSYTLFKLPRVNLFSVGCQRPNPALAFINSSGDLELNMGSETRRTARGYETTKTNEKFVVTQLEPRVSGQATKVQVSAFGLVQTQANGVVFTVGANNKIVANGDNGNDTVLFQAGNSATGAAVEFTLPTEVNGGTGNDTLEGGLGADKLTGGPETIASTETDTDVVKGSEGNDELIGGADSDAVDGAIGNDLISGGSGTDTLSGGAGKDLVQGGADDDTMSGGPGLPRSLAERAIATTESNREAKIARIEDVADLLIGNGGNDSITGHFGNDYIYGDDYAGSSSTLNRALLDGSSFPGSGITNSTACSASAGTGDDSLDGEAGSDVIFGGNGNDEISGGKGSDELCGSAGNDLVEGDSSSATPYTCPSTAPTGCVNDPMEDILRGGSGNDRLLGRVGNDLVEGETGNDYVIGEDGDDKVRGGTGADIALGGAGKDIVLGDEGTFAGTGTSTGITTSGNDVIGTASNSSTGTSGLATCSEVMNVIDGGFDVSGNGTVDTSDDGFVEGIQIIDGRADMDLDGSTGSASAPDTGDNGVLGTILSVISGKADTEGDGDTDTSDDAVHQLFTMMSSSDADCLRGGADHDALFGGSGGDDVSGDSGSDLVAGNDGADVVRGAVDNDFVYGHSGNDTMYGDSGDESMYGGPGVDTVWGGLGADLIEGNEDNDALNGDAGTDRIIGGSSTAATADGNDTISGDDDNDVVIGDNGTISTTFVVALHDLQRGNTAVSATYSGNDTITGGPRADRLYGQGGNDTVLGDGTTVPALVAGIDHLVGGAGSDTMSGGVGTDRLIGGSEVEPVANEPGANDANVSGAGDQLNGGADTDYILGDNGTIVAGTSSTTITRFDDALTNDAADDNTSGNDTIYGDGAADHIQAGGGNDIVYGDARTQEQLSGDTAAGVDKIQGNSGADAIYGHQGNDEIIGGTDAAGVVDQDVGATGLEAGDIIFGHDGDDIVFGDNGIITAGGASRFDDIAASTSGADDTDDNAVSGNDIVYGDAGTDSIQGQGGNDQIFGDVRTQASGGTGSGDVIQGNAGADAIYAHGGMDEIIGGTRTLDPTIAGSMDENVGGFGDVIYGHEGEDKILGDNGQISGNLLIRAKDATVNDGEDEVYSGDDSIYGDDSRDRIMGQGGDDVINGDTGDDLIQGNAGSDVVHGGAGVDHLTGGSHLAGVVDESTSRRGGAVMGDEIYGDDGDDQILGDNGTIQVTQGTLVRHNDATTDDSNPGDAADDVTSGDDDIYGDGGLDEIQAQGGDDVVYGDDRPGAASVGTAGGDLIQGNAGSDVIDSGAGVDDVIGGSDLENRIDESTARRGGAIAGDEIYTADGDDRILGDNGTITAGALVRFNDALKSDPNAGDATDDKTSGDDDIYADGGLDHVQGQGGDDVIYGDERADGSVIGTAGNDLIQGNAGSDVIRSGAGVDDIIGGSHLENRIDESTSRRGGAVAGDEIYGADGDDRILGDNGTITNGVLARHNDALKSDATPGDATDDKTSGDDDIYADGGLDKVQGQGGDDLIYGDIRADGSAVGAAGDDLIQGNAGSDEIRAGAGVDDVLGGSDLAGRIDESTSRRGGATAGDKIHGDAGNDRILGDNGTITNGVLVRLDDALKTDLSAASSGATPTAGDHTDNLTSGDDVIYGNADTDDIQGQGGNDDIFGDAETADSNDGVLDRIQGNAGADDIYGHGGNDDIIGGSDRPVGDNTARIETNVGGVGDQIYGHSGIDRILGDNGSLGATGITRHDDSTSTEDADDLVSNDDDIYGDGDTDQIQAGGGDDRVYGDERGATSTPDTGSADIIQANSGSDVVFGHGGDDDITGGSNIAGIVDGNVDRRLGGTTTGDSIDAGPGLDYVLGDNGTLTPATGQRNWQFFDLYAGGATPDGDLAGRDFIVGDSGDDRIFGQGDDDTIQGSGGDDRIQGNAGSDGVTGDAGADDIVGGSATHYAPSSVDLKNIVDGNDTISGNDRISGPDTANTDADDRGDVILGDNGVIERPVGNDPNTGDPLRTIHLFDVEKKGGHQPSADVSGTDTISGLSRRDFIYGQGKDDVITGGAGDDSIEGNAAADKIDGNDGHDDVIGGTSAAPTSDGGRTAIGTGFPTGPAVTHAADGNDTISTDTGDDAVLGDNGMIRRRVANGLWQNYGNPWQGLLQRDVLAANAAEAAGSFGDDVIDSGAGHDEVHGELGSDTIDAQTGDDSVIGDLGRITMQVVAGPSQPITSAAPFIATNINVPGKLRRNTELFVQTTAGGIDTITAGHGNDVVHSGPANDTVDGNGTVKNDSDGTVLEALFYACHGTPEIENDPADPNDDVPAVPGDPLQCDQDILFGDDGDDVIWGGPHHDHIYGGWGRDKLDVVTPVSGDRTVDFKDADFIYGGWDSDILQADQSQPNPNGMDKLIDAQGAFNDYQVCENAYGGNSVIRAVDPGMILFLQQMATDDGAVNAAAKNSSGFRELSIVFSNEVKFNSSPAIQPTNAVCDPAAYLFGITVVEEEVIVEPTPTPTPTPTVIEVTPTPTPIPSAEASVTPTPTPTPTTVTATPTPTPTATKKPK